MLQNVYTVVLIIFVVNIIYVTLSTVRMILTLKGRRYIAAAVSLIEISVYVVGLSLVLDNLNAIQNVIAYALGFGIGVIVGTKIEEKMALGYITVNVISSEPELDFSGRLRSKGYGVTSWLADGRDGHRLSLQILTPRKYELKLYEDIKEIDPKAFIIAYEPKQIYGGFWVKQVRRGRLFNHRKQGQGAGNQAPPVPAKAEPMAEPVNTPQHGEELDREQHHNDSLNEAKKPLEARGNHRAAGDKETDPAKLPPRARVQTEQNKERDSNAGHQPTETGSAPGPGTSLKEKKPKE